MQLVNWLLVGILAAVAISCLIEVTKLAVLLCESAALSREANVRLTDFHRGLPHFLSEEDEVEVVTVEVPITRHGGRSAPVTRGESSLESVI